MRDSFIFYRSFFEAVKYLDKEAQADCFNAICQYVLDEKEIELEGSAKALFILMKPQLDANNRRYDNGCKGGRKKSEEEPKENQNETKTEPNLNQNRTKLEPNENENENVNDNANENEEIKKHAPVKKKYGEFKKVALTDDELTKLENEYGEEETKQAIDYLDSYIAEKGNKYKSHYLTLRRWVFDAVRERQRKVIKGPPENRVNWDAIV